MIFKEEKSKSNNEKIDTEMVGSGVCMRIMCAKKMSGMDRNEFERTNKQKKISKIAENVSNIEIKVYK